MVHGWGYTYVHKGKEDILWKLCRSGHNTQDREGRTGQQRKEREEEKSTAGEAGQYQ